MNTSLLIFYGTIPVIALFTGSILIQFCRPSKITTSFFQHFAAGVIFAAVALELLPELSQQKPILPFVVGFCCAILLMLIIKSFFPHDSHEDEAESEAIASKTLPYSLLFPIGIDLLIDGLLVGLAFAAGAKGGILVALALAIEVLFLALSMGNALQALNKITVLLINLSLAIAIIVGVGMGTVLTQYANPLLLEGLLSFGVAALLYLVTEELLAEAHEVHDTPITTSAFFLGFMIICVINKMM